MPTHPTFHPWCAQEQVEFTVKPEEDLILEGTERTITRVQAGRSGGWFSDGRGGVAGGRARRGKPVGVVSVWFCANLVRVRGPAVDPLFKIGDN